MILQANCFGQNYYPNFNISSISILREKWSSLEIIYTIDRECFNYAKFPLDSRKKSQYWEKITYELMNIAVCNLLLNTILLCDYPAIFLPYNKGICTFFFLHVYSSFTFHFFFVFWTKVLVLIPYEWSLLTFRQINISTYNYVKAHVRVGVLHHIKLL